MPHDVVTSQSGFEAVIDELRDQPAYSLDTEFHRERTYFPKLALVQLAWRDGLALVDPLQVDFAPFAEILDGPSVAVLHASDQDLEILELTCGTIPNHLFDTQVAAGFVGMSSPSLASVYEKFLGLRVPKADRLSDWLARPLTDAQLDYAASDVDRLLDVYDILNEDLTKRGRLDWAKDECELVRVRARGARDPEDAWRRIKEARQLRGRARVVAQAVAAWRERRAATIDVPVRYVLADLAIVGIAQRPPKTTKDLQKVRGFDGRHIREGQAEDLLATIAAAADAPIPEKSDSPPRELDRDLRPAVGLVSAWVSQLARDQHIDTTLLATRSDLEAFLRGDADARLAVGWRKGLVGEPIRRLVDGEAALAFAGNGELTLEERSHKPIA